MKKINSIKTNESVILRELAKEIKKRMDETKNYDDVRGCFFDGQRYAYITLLGDIEMKIWELEYGK